MCEHVCRFLKSTFLCTLLYMIRHQCTIWPSLITGALKIWLCWIVLAISLLYRMAHATCANLNRWHCATCKENESVATASLTIRGLLWLKKEKKKVLYFTANTQKLWKIQVNQSIFTNRFLISCFPHPCCYVTTSAQPSGAQPMLPPLVPPTKALIGSVVSLNGETGIHESSSRPVWFARQNITCRCGHGFRRLEPDSFWPYRHVHCHVLQSGST